MCQLSFDTVLKCAHTRCLPLCRQDPPSKDQFGDGKYQVQWTRDLEKYEWWWQKGTTHTQQLGRQLEEEGRSKSAARVRTPILLWHAAQ